jgi:DNA-binding response OmpR family regulator
MPLKLLIADDSTDVAEVVAFGARIAWPDCQVLVAADGQQTLDCFAKEQPDLVVLDVAMPPPDGFEVCRRIRALSPVPILMLTVHDATPEKVQAFDLGADDYLTKPFDHLELLARLRALVRRSQTQPIASAVSAVVAGREGADAFILGTFILDYALQELHIGGVLVPLTSTEYRLLEELVRHAGIVLSHRQLLERVWGPEYVNDTHYLKVFVQRLRHKLCDDPNHPRYIHTEWGRGYRFTSPAATRSASPD